MNSLKTGGILAMQIYNEVEPLKNFYFDNFQERDAQLVELRKRFYGSDTQSMIKRYQNLLKKPGSDQRNLTEDIRRLEGIHCIDIQLKEQGCELNGKSVNVSTLVDLFEGQRKKKGGNGIKSLLL